LSGQVAAATILHMAGTQTDAEFWAEVERFLCKAEASLGFAHPPAVVPFPYEGEAWKEQAQVDDREDACFFETQSILTTYCQKQEWPRKWPADAAYFARLRIAWARRWLRILRIPWEKTGYPFMARPPESGAELAEWLVTTAYNSRNPPHYDPPLRIIGPQDIQKPT
jgi:hypothetical protein